ncbi:hypothetical protein [Brevibacillus fluminis]|uniref:hypothetical protein n=1 Tax=Brevibacillus fluminis TaxID=511487 RepID=UPI001FEA96AF|nr:hypothetical protein [Brevibacillus fluminis]
MEKRIYKPLDTLTDEEIKKILASGSFDELAMLPLSVGMHHANWKIAQTLCVKLAGHTDERIRANAILGLAYIAMTKGKLEKHIVKPLLLRELRTNVEYKW